MQDTRADETATAALRERHTRLGDSAPRFGLFLFDCPGADALHKIVERIPESVDDWLEEVVVMLDDPSRTDLARAEGLVAGRSLVLRFHRPPRPAGPGGQRKAALEYAARAELDHAIVLRGDGSHPPEKLPEIIQAVLDEPSQLLLVTRSGRRRPKWPQVLAHTLAHTFAHALSTFVQNRILGLRLRDYHTSYRVYPCEALERIPYQLDDDGVLFDAEIILQFRALDVPVRELELLDAGRGDGSGNDGVVYGAGACAKAVGLRLHQAHFTRDGRYLVDHDIHYTLKLSVTSSHMQIVSAIEPGSEVLDLGCSQGLLAKPLAEKDVRVTGVDAGVARRLAEELACYHQSDLEEPLEIPYGRIFDYVVCADVIEHIQNRGQLLRSARRYLKEDGRLIISTPNIALWFYRLSLLIGRFEYGPRGVLDETHVHLFTGSTFRREVEKAGFSVVRQRVTALPFEVVFESTGRSRFVRHLAGSYHALARAWPSMFAYQYVLEAEITTLDEEATESADAQGAD
jgi:2-polyprenyl-3-methyl-5-hydroxy-6-metoxy-1,4-benzoquinol methylase